MKDKLAESIHHRFVFAILPVCTFMSVLLMVCLLAGCSLARTDTPGNTGTDRLCGIWVVSDTSICYDNPEGFEDDGANYICIERLTSTASDGQSDLNSESDSNKESSSSTTTSAEETNITCGNIFLTKYVQNTDDAANSTLSVTGALYLSSDKVCDEYMIPIYQRPDGTHYRGTFLVNTWYADNRNPTPLSFASTETFSTSEGETRSDKIEITIAYEVRDACTDARIIEMDKDNLVIRTTALDLDQPAITGSSEYEITTLPETKYVIVEESSGEGTSAKIYRTIYCRSEESGSLPAIHIIAVPGENEVLIPQKLQVRFG